MSQRQNKDDPEWEETDPPPARPNVQLSADIDQVADEAETALIASGLPIYQRGIFLMMPISMPVTAANDRETIAPAFKQMKTTSLRDHLSRAASFERYDNRGKKWMQCPPPSYIADIILSRDGQWRFKHVVGIIYPDSAGFCLRDAKLV
jgi:putative DNA primase/helicase